jgi:purine-binding chemotaxis protein CheW
MANQLPTTDSGNSPGQRSLVAFRLHRQTYALPIEPVVQIVELVAITPIPQLSQVVEGVINVRGAIVPLVNMRRHLGLPEASLHLHTPIVLVRAGERVVGLIVDEVLDVLSLADERIARSADVLPQELGEVPLLQGLARTPDGMVLLLDLEHLFLPHQAQALDQAVAALSEAAESVEELEELPVEVDTTPDDVVVEEEAEGTQQEPDLEVET